MAQAKTSESKISDPNTSPKPKLTPAQIQKAAKILIEKEKPDFLKFCEQKGCKFPKESLLSGSPEPPEIECGKKPVREP